MRIIVIFAFIITLTAIACKQNDADNQKKIQPEIQKDDLEYANRHMVRYEDRQINDFVNRYNWNAERTSTGLRFLKYKEGSGIMPTMGSIVRIHFKVSLINGIECYNSEIDGPKEFVIGRSNEINGLEEGLLKMRVGDKAKLIIPSHLAFGLPGDSRKIPMRATVIYDVELLSVQNN